jgi:hypothetical protein
MLTWPNDLGVFKIGPQTPYNPMLPLYLVEEYILKWASNSLMTKHCLQLELGILFHPVTTHKTFIFGWIFQLFQTLYYETVRSIISHFLNSEQDMGVLSRAVPWDRVGVQL